MLLPILIHCTSPMIKHVEMGGGVTIPAVITLMPTTQSCSADLNSDSVAHQDGSSGFKARQGGPQGSGFGAHQDGLLQGAPPHAGRQEGLDDLLIQVGAQRCEPVELHLRVPEREGALHKLGEASIDVFRYPALGDM